MTSQPMLNLVQSEGLRASEQCNIGIFQGGIAVDSTSQDIGRSRHAPPPLPHTDHAMPYK